MYKIPFNPSKSADQALQVLIPELAVLSIRLLWNNREEAWHMDLQVGSSTIYGVRLNVGVPLLHGLRATSPVPGDFIVLPADREVKALDYNGLGSSFNLFYMLPEDVAAWEAANGMG